MPRAPLVGFDVLAFAFASAVVGVAACLRSDLALGVGAAGRESAEVRPFADDDEGLVGAWDLEAPPGADSFLFVAMSVSVSGSGLQRWGWKK